MASRFVSSLLTTIKRPLNLIYRPGRDGLKEDVNKLNRLLRRVQATVEELEHREIHDETVKLWLQELKCLASDAEDVIDEYNYELLQCQLEVKGTIPASPFDEYNYELFQCNWEVKAGIPASPFDKNGEANTAMENGASSCFSKSISAELVEKIRKINCQFDEISRDREALHLTSEEGKRKGTASYINLSLSSHMMNKDDIFGRNDDKKKIIDRMLWDEDRKDLQVIRIVGLGVISKTEMKDRFQVIPIVGMGGIGKTTLAQMVYDDPFVQSMFDVMAWVYVSPEFDIVRLTKEISEFVTGSSFDGFNKNQEVIQKELVGKKMILVLDDVWNMYRYDWEMLFLPLRNAKFVRVLVTSRNDVVAQSLPTTVTHHRLADMLAQSLHTIVTHHRLDVLPEHECWKLFLHCAFGEEKIAKPAWLEKIGRQIIKKCGGLPLAVKCIAGVLRYNKDKDSWKEILYSELWESNEFDSVFRALKVSYYHLPHKLRDCFLFCSLFPKGSRLRKVEIIYMWMAHGFLQRKGTKIAEDLGEEYLQELQMRSFILLDSKGCFILHDVIYDLARSISMGEIHTIMDENSSHLSDQIRHLYIKRGNEPCESFRPRRLRTLFNGSSFHLDDLWSVRVLGLIGSNVYVLKSSFCRLKHLRYLAIKEVRDLETLPDSICLLYNLQTLKLSYCYQLRRLPSNISNLVNLRYLHIAHVGIKELPLMLWQVHNLKILHLEECGNLELLPPGISNLTNLQILRLKSCKNLLELPSDIGTLVNRQVLLELPSAKLESVNKSLSLDQVMMMATSLTTTRCEEKQKNVMVLIYTTKVETSHKVIDITHVYEYNELRRKLAFLVGTEGWQITYCQSSWDEEFPFGSESWQDFVRSVRIIKIRKILKKCNEDNDIPGSANTWMSSSGSSSHENQISYNFNFR